MRSLVSLCGLLFLTGFAASSGAGELPAQPGSVRLAVTRCLPFMEKEGLAWMKSQGCVSCHQIPMMIWSFNATQRQGFVVEGNKIGEWNERALKDTFAGNFIFKLPEKALADLLQAGASESEVTRLRWMKDREFLRGGDFWQAVAEQLAAEPAPKLKEQILKAATKPGLCGAAGDGETAIFAALLPTGITAATKVPRQAQTILLDALVRARQKDNLWQASAQFYGMNRSREETNAVNSGWIVLSLDHFDPLPEPLASARDRALAAIKAQPPGASTEWTLVRLMLAHREGESRQEAEWLDKLWRLQRPDGGWAFRSESPCSDALTTGQVLYGITTAGQKLSTAPLQRAIRYLLQAQKEDGSWEVPWINFNKENNKDHTKGTKIFSYWGSGWALIGLLKTLDGSAMVAN